MFPCSTFTKHVDLVHNTAFVPLTANKDVQLDLKELFRPSKPLLMRLQRSTRTQNHGAVKLKLQSFYLPLRSIPTNAHNLVLVFFSSSLLLRLAGPISALT
jgi:hypothetical protein